MSFFNEIYKVFDINETIDNISLSYVENKGFLISGKFKILTFNENIISIKTSKNIIIFEGLNFVVKTMAKGEIAIVGKILNICFGDKNDK